MTPKETKAYRAALTRIIRNTGKVVMEHDKNDSIALGGIVRNIGQAAPSIVAAHLLRLIKKRGNIWERYNNHRPFDDAATKQCDDRCDTIQVAVDGVLALFGITANWGVGIYPVLTVNGRTEHQLLRGIRESFEGKATR